MSLANSPMLEKSSLTKLFPVSGLIDLIVENTAIGCLNSSNSSRTDESRYVNSSQEASSSALSPVAANAHKLSCFDGTKRSQIIRSTIVCSSVLAEG
ncbi:hypothetical protein KL920_001849 [Ogataea angusta]|nr:hypothetical protein KL920_001849 [Ogataea angusta]